VNFFKLKRLTFEQVPSGIVFESALWRALLPQRSVI
jgi:hypothetical protein